MLISESWLREWVDPAVSTEELMAQVTMAGLEVDGHEAAAKAFTGVVVGEVLSAEQHPDADKLSVCRVTDGREEYQVVCGAANVRAGLRVPFAQVGAVLGDDFTIGKAKLRGVESFGMLCAAEELGLAETSEGLMELPDDAPVGSDFREWLQLEDTLIEIDLTPNRGDCLSIRGIAREVGVLNKASVTEPAIETIPASIDDSIQIEIRNPEDCPRYLGRIIRNINPGVESPLWLQEKLRRCGLRSIDPVVDVTNYVLMELGQPMHAFDLSKIDSGIVVRRADRNEKLELLDGKNTTLREDTLLIADQSKALAIAGVMGGAHSAVTESTSDILLESAFFSPLAIAGKARSYGLQTDAAHRYERGVDYALAHQAMQRATGLLLKIVGGEAGPVTEATGKLPEDVTITLRQERISRLLGLDISSEDVEEMLGGLGLTLVSKDDDSWQWSIPSWRFDLNIEVDLIEELARITGYDSLPSRPLNNPVVLRPQHEEIRSMKSLRKQLHTLGYQEVITYSFVESELNENFGAEGGAVSLANPLSSELSVMRQSLWSGLVKTLKHNQNRQQSRVRLFETGLVFSEASDGVSQESRLGGLIWGDIVPEQWAAKGRAIDFFDAKGDLETLFGGSLSDYDFTADEHPALQPGQTARISRQGEHAGWLGALHPSLQKTLDIPGKVYLFELKLNLVRRSQVPVFKEVSKFPSVRRDLALLVDTSVESSALQACLKDVGGENLVKVLVFDVYLDEKLAKGKKSIALGLTFQHPSRTLTDEEIDSIISSGIKALQDKFNIELRM